MVTMDTQITSRFNHSLELKKHLAKLIRGVEKRTTAPAIAAAKLLFFLDN
jgi:hypothetical protein